jgi:hypothetical protein
MANMDVRIDALNSALGNWGFTGIGPFLNKKKVAESATGLLNL